YGGTDAPYQCDVEEEINRDDDRHDADEGFFNETGIGGLLDRNGTDLKTGKRPVHNNNRRKQAGGGEWGSGSKVFHPDKWEKKECDQDQRDDLDKGEDGFGLSREGDPDDVD